MPESICFSKSLLRVRVSAGKRSHWWCNTLCVRGHHRVVIDPAASNERAIACYRACGFVPVGVMRRYERDVDGDGWHDGLLMEYVVEN